MTTRELLHAEIDRMDEEAVGAVYDIVRRGAISRATNGSGDLLSLLREVKIVGPVDFSENLDLYLSGEKRVEDNLP